MSQPRILLLGVGNILYSDEGIGVHAVQHLERHYRFSDNVRLMDGGVMGKLLMEPITSCDRLIVMDAVLGKHDPGTLYRLEGEALRQSLGFHDSQHQVDLEDVLVCCEMVGNRPEAVVIGMEPQDWKTMQMQLTQVCRDKMPEFLDHVLRELREQGGEAWPLDGEKPFSGQYDLPEAAN